MAEEDTKESPGYRLKLRDLPVDWKRYRDAHDGDQTTYEQRLRSSDSEALALWLIGHFSILPSHMRLDLLNFADALANGYDIKSEL